MAHRVCPWWAGYLLISPLRRLAHDPQRIVGPYLEPGMTALDFGCGMGHFSLAMARGVGTTGRVVCVDLQPRMLVGLARRAARAGLRERLELRQASPEDTGLSSFEARVDFALAVFVIHEVEDQQQILRDLAGTLKPAGRLLLAEPKIHVREREFLRTLACAEAAGLVVAQRPAMRRARAVLLAPAPR